MSSSYGRAHNDEKRRLYKAAIAPSSVIYKGRADIPLAARHNTTPKGNVVTRYTKSKYQPGDTQPMFGKDVVAFTGGEGGRGWKVNSTRC